MNIIRELRKKKGIQQKELSIEIGVSQPTVSDWEKGKKDPSSESLKKLAEYFGVDELVILGKGVVDLASNESVMPKTPEARIISECIDNMPEEKRKQALSIFSTIYNLKGGNNE